MTFVPILLLILTLMVEYKLRDHIKNNYPEEWAKANESKMGVKASQSRPIFLSDSMRTGYLSKQNDSTLNRLSRFQKYITVLFAVCIIANLVIAGV